MYLRYLNGSHPREIAHLSYLLAATSALKTGNMKMDCPSSSSLFSSGYSFGGGYILVKFTLGIMGPKYMFGSEVLKWKVKLLSVLTSDFIE